MKRLFALVLLVTAEAAHGQAYISFAIDPPNATQAGGLVRSAITRPGVDVRLQAGQYDFGQLQTRLGAVVSVRGSHRDETIFTNSGAGFSAQACAFEVGPGLTEISDLTFRSDVTAGQQSQTFGSQGRAAAIMPTVLLNRVGIEGHSFALYFWGGPDTGQANPWCSSRECRIVAGRWGATLGNASGTLDGRLDFLDTVFELDYEPRIGAGGDIGNTQAAVVARGGQVHLRGGSIRCKGSPKCDKQSGLWASCQPHPPGPSWSPLIVAENVDCKLDPNGTPDWCDARADVGKIVIVGGRGSGSNGEWIVKGNVEVHQAKAIRQ